MFVLTFAVSLGAVSASWEGTVAVIGGYDWGLHRGRDEWQLVNVTSGLASATVRSVGIDGPDSVFAISESASISHPNQSLRQFASCLSDNCSFILTPRKLTGAVG